MPEWKNVVEIEPSQSTLARLIYRRPGSLKRHIERVLVRPYDALILCKFKPHLPAVGTVSETLEFFDQLLEWMAGDDRGYPSPCVVRVLDRDWFMEICAALGAVGGLAALAQFIVQLRQDKRATRQESQSSTVATSVPAGGGQMQVRRQVIRRQVWVSYDKIGGFRLTEVHEYFEENLEYVETYELPLKVTRIFYRDKQEETGDSS